MVRMLGLNLGASDEPREITREAPTSENGESGWLVRFFDSAFFCEWIAVSYLYKHEHPGVRDYLCNRMYTLPLSGIESYLFQICYMLVHKPSPSLDKFVIDICSKSLQIALKVHWFLLAELEDTDDNEGISRIQEKCQIAATLMGEWSPLFRQQNPPSSPKSRNPMLTRILSSKQRLLSLASSPPMQRSASSISTSPSSNSSIQDESGKVSSEENALFRKLMPVRDTLFRRSVEKDKEKDSNDLDRDGFFKRLLRDGKDEESEVTASSDNFLKRLFRDSKHDSDDKSSLRIGEDDEKDGFFRRLFKDKNEEQKDGPERFENEDKEFHDDGHDFKHSRTSLKFGEDDDKEGFLCKPFKEKNEERRNVNDQMENEDKRFHDDKHKSEDSKASLKLGEEDEKEGFFSKLFKEKNEEKKDIDKGFHDCKHELEYNSRPLKMGEEDEKISFFRKLFKEKHEEKKKEVGRSDNEDSDFHYNNHNSQDKTLKLGHDDERESFFHRFFKEKNEELSHDRAESEERNQSYEEEDFLSFRRLFRIHPEEAKSSSQNENISSPGSENFFRRLFRDRDKATEDSELFSLKKHKEKHPGSPKQQNEKSYAKPPLPNNMTSQIRKGTYHASLDFVHSLCATSYGLVDVFPIEDRKFALRESLAEINTNLTAASNQGGVCFPMGKGMYRVVHIPEDEAILLNSREKAPYLVCVEVLKSEYASHAKETFDANKLSRCGIPLANGDVQFAKPPPWAYPLWSTHDLHRNGQDMALKSTSQSIDEAMTHLWEAKMKLVHVGLSVEKNLLDHSNNGYSKEVEVDGKHDSLQSTSFDLKIPIMNTISSLNSSDDREANHGDFVDWINVVLTAIPGVNMEDVDDQDPPRRKDHRRVPSTIAIEEVKAAAAKGEAPPGLPLKGAGQDSSDAQPKDASSGLPKPTDALSGELWELKRERIRKASIFGKSPGWDLRSFIVKSGDDCRQEHLAVQLVSHFYDIFQEAGLPLWLRPYEVLVTSSYTALIETIPDTASLHSIKSRFSTITSLRDFFEAKYKDNSSFKLAQRNFVESMAGYSILCYFLQVKDRHNGNLLMDEEGHIIHIDFGFMLSNSPGGVNFESAPFKLTRELLEVMDSDAEGSPSDFFDYFKVLCIHGFLTCRKHAERIILLVEMLQDSGFPCFKGGPRAIQNLRKRFHLSLTEEQCVSLVLSLISSSLDAWRTRQYDYYQRVLNGIL